MLLCHAGGTTFGYHGFAMNEETKRCPMCEYELPRERFGKRPDGRCASYCRACQLIYSRNHYAADSTPYKRRRQESSRRYRLRNQRYAFDYLRAHPCVDCGESDPVVLEFDHIEQNSKERNVSILIRKGCALERLQREISRCEVRCAGCHRRRTSVQLGWNLARYRHEAR